LPLMVMADGVTLDLAFMTRPLLRHSGLCG
jgi:hypothetical protein